MPSHELPPGPEARARSQTRRRRELRRFPHPPFRAAETAEPGGPALIVTGHPVSGYIRIEDRHRKKR